MKTFARVPPPVPPALPELPAFERFLIVLGRRVAPLEPRPETVAVLREASSLRLLPPWGVAMRPDAAATHVLVVAKGLLRTFEEVRATPGAKGAGQAKGTGTGQASRADGGKGQGKGPGKDDGKDHAKPAGKGPAKGGAKAKAPPGDGVVERTWGFFEAGTVLADVGALLGGRPSGLGVQAVEEAAVLRLPWEALRQVADADHALERWSRLLVEEAFLATQGGVAGRALDGARGGMGGMGGGSRGGRGELPVEVRYRAFLEGRPMLAGRLPAWLVASYLGISTEALAQLRSRRFRTPGGTG